MIKINFVDFWPNFRKTDNYFFNLLNSKYEVVIDEVNPDLLFFSVDYYKQRERDKYKNHACKKIFYTGENVRPNLNFPGSIEYAHYSIGKSDFAFTFDFSNDPREYRLPLWALFINWFDVPHNEDRDQSYLIPLQNLLNRDIAPKEKFCNFIFSNSSGERINILKNLAQYKKVDCVGSLMNNMGYKIKGRGDQKYKVEFLENYRFTIAAENSSFEGYTTEKIIHPFSVGSIPIYWGSLRVGEDFNKKAFIDVNDYDTIDSVVEKVKSIEENEEEYLSYLREPVFIDNKIPDSVLPARVLEFFEENIIC